ncbi:hypothetical protein B0T16DRAFT_222174 [Cercophora newfieldiana]|uniref:Uncharacterized protein n=1 Tax=Cercophora newfieldiana TaxID=92897 RepID=A0AA39XXJ8_9PEZI|nr:hypothetical protein B0T16DRAFT_222174 [Cercophora newfieldiana]
MHLKLLSWGTPILIKIAWSILLCFGQPMLGRGSGCGAVRPPNNRLSLAFLILFWPATNAGGIFNPSLFSYSRLVVTAAASADVPTGKSASSSRRSSSPAQIEICASHHPSSTNCSEAIAPGIIAESADWTDGLTRGSAGCRIWGRKKYKHLLDDLLGLGGHWTEC